MRHSAQEELSSTDFIIDDILEFWFAAPAADAEAMQRKITRWFMGGELMDREIRQRLRSVFTQGAERAEHYHSVIERFGRFPHRNTILGRASSQEELAFLASHPA